MGKLEKTGQEVIAYQGRMLEIITQDMSNGEQTIAFEWARRTPGVRLILVDAKKKTVVLTKEHRYELGTDDFRLPGGKVFDSLVDYNTFLKSGGGGILEAARQKAHEEAEEEVGLELQAVDHFHTSACGSMIDWDLYYWVSTKWKRVKQKLGVGEEISVVEVSFEKAKEIIMNGEMSEERSALALLRYLSSKA